MFLPRGCCGPDREKADLVLPDWELCLHVLDILCFRGLLMASASAESPPSSSSQTEYYCSELPHQYSSISLLSLLNQSSPPPPRYGLWRKCRFFAKQGVNVGRQNYCLYSQHKMCESHLNNDGCKSLSSDLDGLSNLRASTQWRGASVEC